MGEKVISKDPEKLDPQTINIIHVQLVLATREIEIALAITSRAALERSFLPLIDRARRLTPVHNTLMSSYTDALAQLFLHNRTILIAI